MWLRSGGGGGWGQCGGGLLALVLDRAVLLQGSGGFGVEIGVVVVVVGVRVGVVEVQRRQRWSRPGWRVVEVRVEVAEGWSWGGLQARQNRGIKPL
jgi:hypothetical protein